MKYPLLFLSFLFLYLPNADAQVPEMTENTNTLLGMVLMNEMELMDYPSIEQDIVDTWGIYKRRIDGNDQTISFVADSVTFMIGFIPAPVPGNDLSTAIEYSYMWKDARSALNNKSHIIIAVVGEKSQLELYRHFTQITAILLEHTNSMGVYMGKQSLVHSKEFFISEAESMSDEHLPLYLWLYFGMQQDDERNSAFTYGLKEFGLNEIEIVGSDKPMEEVVDFLYHSTEYVVAGNITLQDGETISLSEEQKIKITLSNGANLDGKTLKLDY